MASSKEAPTPNYSRPIEDAGTAILKAGRGDQPTMNSEKTA